MPAVDVADLERHVDRSHDQDPEDHDVEPHGCRQHEADRGSEDEADDPGAR